MTSDTVEERLEELDKTMTNVKDTYGKVKQRIVALGEEVKEHDVDLDGIVEEIRDIRRYVE